jgi:hypothetical protein
MAAARWADAHPNSLYWLQIVGDPKRMRAYKAWLKRIGGDVSAMNRFASEQTREPARFSR